MLGGEGGEVRERSERKLLGGLEVVMSATEYLAFGGEAREFWGRRLGFGGEASPLPPPLDRTLMMEVSVVLIIKPWCEFVILIFRILMTLNHLQGGGSSKGKWKKSLTHLMMTLSSPTGRSQLSKELEIV